MSNPSIFLSYRRDDSHFQTGFIYDRLVQVFGEEAVFFDVDSIPYGVDFAEYLDLQVSQCQVFIAVIGRDWADVVDENGNRRLLNEDDFVRIEIESALRRGIPVIPLLLYPARMPSRSQLPESMHSLVRRNGLLVRSASDFNRDMDRLIKGIELHLKPLGTKGANSFKELPGKQQTKRSLVTGKNYSEDLGDNVELLSRAEPPDDISESVFPIEPDQSSSSEASKGHGPLTPATVQPSEAQLLRDIKEPKSPKPLTTPIESVVDGERESYGSHSAKGVKPNKEGRKALPFYVSRRRALQLGGFTIAGITATVIGRKLLQTRFKFDVVTVNAQGEIADRQARSVEGLTQALGSGVNLEMVSIPGGTFTMGSPETEEGRDEDEGPQRQVAIAPFMMGRFQVTQAEYRAIMGSNPSRFTSEGGNHPVEKVSWSDAEEFCERLSEETGREYRLPSEAEWEYACRAGTMTPFHFGETITTDLANYDGERGETTPVGSFDVANEFGLYDMHGNVWEWCTDHWHENYDDAPSGGTPWIEGGDSNRMVLRGGSWNDLAGSCRSAYRLRYNLEVGNNVFIGFRVVCSSA